MGCTTTSKYEGILSATGSTGAPNQSPARSSCNSSSTNAYISEDASTGGAPTTGSEATEEPSDPATEQVEAMARGVDGARERTDVDGEARGCSMEEEKTRLA